MCFSPEMDLVAGVTVGGLGLEALRHVHRRRDVPLGTLPLLLGAHQLIEAFVWWGERGQVAADTGRMATWLYMTVAYVVLPVLVPIAVLAIEPERGRRRIMAWFGALGALVAVLYLQGMIQGQVSASIAGHTVVYDTGVKYGSMLAALYMVATVGAMLASTDRHIVAFGTANLVALPVLVLLSTHALASLWCAWAAVASVVIVRHLRDNNESEFDYPSPGMILARLRDRLGT